MNPLTVIGSSELPPSPPPFFSGIPLHLFHLCLTSHSSLVLWVNSCLSWAEESDKCNPVTKQCLSKIIGSSWTYIQHKVLVVLVVTHLSLLSRFHMKCSLQQELFLLCKKSQSYWRIKTRAIGWWLMYLNPVFHVSYSYQRVDWICSSCSVTYLDCGGFFRPLGGTVHP